MDSLAVVQIVGWAVGLVFGLAVAARLVAVRHAVSRLFALTMFALAVNAAVLLGLQVYASLVGVDCPDWGCAGLTVDAVLFGGCALAVYLLFLLRYNGD